MEKWIEAWRVDEVLHDAWVNRPLDSDRWVIGDIQKALADLPAADVAPVRRGEWIGTEFDGYADGKPVYYEWKCSACGCIVEDEEPTWNFCPNCGAKMDASS